MTVLTPKGERPRYPASVLKVQRMLAMHGLERSPKEIALSARLMRCQVCGFEFRMCCAMPDGTYVDPPNIFCPKCKDGVCVCRGSG